jgi:predicted transcriptional regulator
LAPEDLDVLERENYVQSARDGRFKRFYSTDVNVPNGKLRRTPDEVRTALVEIVRGHPGISQKELVREMGIDRDTVGYHLRALIKEDALDSKKMGRYTVYTVNGKQ